VENPRPNVMRAWVRRKRDMTAVVVANFRFALQLRHLIK
jgi:hypothetical protein